MGTPGNLANEQIQRALLGEAIASAGIGFVVWDEDRRYVAANTCACELLGCRLEQLLGSVVGERTVEGEDVVRRVVAGEGGRGLLVTERFDGGSVALEYVSFSTKMAGVPYMASLIWPASER